MEAFDSGIRNAVAWCLKHSNWVVNVQNGVYRNWADLKFELRA